MFHFGILAVFAGHVMGLGIPKSWTEAVGISESTYHAMAIGVGLLAGLATVVGMALLVYRRRTNSAVFGATTRMDKLMYLMLGVVVFFGLTNTIASGVLQLFNDYDYRDGVSVWFRGIFTFQLHPELMAAAPFPFQAHGMSAMLLFALWPFTRLVHVFSAPLFYLWRPYVVYRAKPERFGARAPRRGWEKSENTRR